MTKVPHHQRAIIFQGGGALGAYEVGFYEALYERFIKQKKYKNPFDIVAGTSIGAINGALLVSYYKKNQTWEGSVEHIKDYWEYVSSSAPFSDMFTEMWYQWRKLFPDAPSKEEARRMFSVNEFLARGVPNVFTVPQYRFDPEFYTFSEPWYQSTNQGLRDSLEKFINFPISTDYEKDEPRLLLVASDVQEALPVIFDSYAKPQNRKHGTVYGQKPSKDGKGSEGGYIIEYDGVEVDHILASANVPLNYDYTVIAANEVTKFDRETGNVTKGKESKRYFWDGGILHNTPIQPLIRKYKSFWDYYVDIHEEQESLLNGETKKVTQYPEMYTYIVDMWAQKSTKVPESYNDTKSRYYEIMFSDKTEFEERILNAFNEHVRLHRDLVKLAAEKGATHDELKELLEKPLKTRLYAGVQRRNIDLATGFFDMKIMRISRRDDPDDIAHQAFDFSPKTIEILAKEGYEDSKKALDEYGI